MTPVQLPSVCTPVDNTSSSPTFNVTVAPTSPVPVAVGVGPVSSSYAGLSITGLGSNATNVHNSLGSDATPFTVCTTLTMLMGGAQFAVGVKVRVVPAVLKLPTTSAPISLSIFRVTVPEETPVMVNTCFAAAGLGGGVITGFGGFAVNVHNSLGSDATPPTVWTTLIVLVPGTQFAVGVKPRVVPPMLKSPATFASASVSTLRVTVPVITPVIINPCLGPARLGGREIEGLGGFAVNVHSSLGSDATPFTVCTTLTVLVPGAQFSVGVKVRVVPVVLKLPATLAPALLSIFRVTVPV
ncbi:hypothetical protein D3C85_706400 [compost metagenome]